MQTKIAQETSHTNIAVWGVTRSQSLNPSINPSIHTSQPTHPSTKLPNTQTNYNDTEVPTEISGLLNFVLIQHMEEDSKVDLFLFKTISLKKTNQSINQSIKGYLTRPMLKWLQLYSQVCVK